MRFAIFGIVVDVIFTVFVTVFAASADAKAVRNLPKWVWILFCIFLSPIGGILYLAVGRPLPNKGDRQPKKTVVPDDDPDFLRNLSNRLRDQDKDKE